jgi:hypothetical protein
MSYIGQTLPADTFQGFTTDSFAGDGSATTFTLSKTPFNESALLVVINNVVQKPTTNFTVSGTTLTIVGTAVASGDVIYATHIGGALPIGQAASLDLNGASDQLILDADGDTTISADTDDQIDFKAGGTDRMHIASDGDVLISKTSNAYQTTGHEFLDGGRAFHTADGGKALSLVRNSSNGAIMDFYNSSGSEVGSIETAASGIGIKLGGTASANLLDDYEEGNTSDLTLSPGTSGSISLQDSFRQLSYTKVGRLVTITGMLKITSVSSPTGAPTFTLPFVLASNSDTGEIVRGHGYVVNAAAAENGDGGLIIDVQTAGSATASIFKTDNTTNGLRDFDSTFATSQAEINFSFSYFSA